MDCETCARELDALRERFEQLYALGVEMAGLGNFPERAASVAAHMGELWRADMVIWYDADEAAEKLVPLAACGASADTDRREVAFHQGLVGHAAAFGQPYFIRDVRTQALPVDYCMIAEQEQLVSLLIVPVQRLGVIFGCFLVGRRRAVPFNDLEYTMLLNVANQAAVVQENRRLYKMTQNMAIVEERSRISRELHDGAAQMIALLGMKVRALEAAVGRGAAGDLAARCREMQDIIADTYRQLRYEIDVLRQHDDTECLHDLRALLAHAGAVFSVQTVFDAPAGAAFRLWPEARLQLQRVVQEALFNAGRHAHASLLSLAVCVDARRLTVVVRDNGRGFDLTAAPPLGRHWGLYIMEERMRAVGGDLVISTAPGAGTRVEITLPLAQEGADGYDPYFAG